MTHYDDWYELHQLFGGYLHQQWDDDYATVPDVIADAAQNFDEAVLGEFERLHALHLDEESTREFLRECSCAVRPEGFGKTPKEFVAWIEELLRAELARAAEG